MGNITKHYSEQEGECNYCEDTWVHFFVIWDTIGVHYILECSCEFIDFKIGRWHQQLRSLNECNLSSTKLGNDLIYQICLFARRAPIEANIKPILIPLLQQIHRLIQSLLLNNETSH